MNSFLKFSAAVLLAASCVGCASDLSANSYDTVDAGTVSKVVPGVVVSMRQVRVNGDNSVGTTSGAIAGGLVGASAGGHSFAGSVIGATAGAIIGGTAGGAVDSSLSRQHGVELIIKTKRYGMLSLVQAADQHLRVGDHVLVIYGARSRVVLDQSYTHTPRPHAKHAEAVKAHSVQQTRSQQG